jgi:ferrous iron transport protein B
MTQHLVAVAGQPNSGKSTIFNLLTGARQFVANYPGVTVEKKTGFFKEDGASFTLVDLPGTYSLTSYSLEERVARDFLLDQSPRLTLNVVDASNLKRNLYLTFQLLEMELDVVVDLNMIDVAEGRGVAIDHEELSRSLGVPVAATNAKKGRGKAELRRAIKETTDGEARSDFRVDYGQLEPVLAEIIQSLEAVDSIANSYPRRWLAIKLLEGDEKALEIVESLHPHPEVLLALINVKRQEFESEADDTAESFIGWRRHLAAEEIVRACVKAGPAHHKKPLTDRIDRIVIHRVFGPVILLGILAAIYQLAIGYGYELTNYTWPVLAWLQSLVESILPAQGFLTDPMLRSFGEWMVVSVNALLNYIPIFFILFALIAVLEDIGYMPRMAFILDRILRRFGLHGQSTLPLVLGGVLAGGCAIPGVMACKAIPDERARMATILTVPMMNCLAKVPLYILLIDAYFKAQATLAFLFISTVTIFMALPTAKLLTLTVLRHKENAPFIMEMPPYHLPTLSGVMRRALERIWLFLRKIVTVVAAVAVILFVLLQFPGLSDKRMAFYQGQKDKAMAKFQARIKSTPYAAKLKGQDLDRLAIFWAEYKKARLGAGPSARVSIDLRFKDRNPLFFKIVKPGRDKAARRVSRAFKKVIRVRKRLRRLIKAEQLNNSILGVVGRWIEPVTRWAGFNWKVNVALLGSFAAKESSVATLGALYQPTDEGSQKRTAASMKDQAKNFTPLHALAIMLFMALYPPCIPAAIMVKIQSGRWRWMFFSILYATGLGLAVATLVFTGGTLLGLTGLQAMFIFYGLAVAATIGLGLIPNRGSKTSQEGQ